MMYGLLTPRDAACRLATLLEDIDRVAAAAQSRRLAKSVKADVAQITRLAHIYAGGTPELLRSLAARSMTRHVIHAATVTWQCLDAQVNHLNSLGKPPRLARELGALAARARAIIDGLDAWAFHASYVGGIRTRHRLNAEREKRLKAPARFVIRTVIRLFGADEISARDLISHADRGDLPAFLETRLPGIHPWVARRVADELELWLASCEEPAFGDVVRFWAQAS